MSINGKSEAFGIKSVFVVRAETASLAEAVTKSFVYLSFTLFCWSLTGIQCHKKIREKFETSVIHRSFFLSYFRPGWEEFVIKTNENRDNFHCESFIIQFLINFLCITTRI